MKTKTLRGELYPINPKAVNYSTPYYIYKALTDQKLTLAIYRSKRWDRGIIEANSTFTMFDDEVVGETVTDEAYEIIKSIANFVKSEGVSELELKGKLTFTLEDTETSETNTIRITVRKGVVTYQQASYVWTDETAFSSTTTSSLPAC